MPGKTESILNKKLLRLFIAIFFVLAFSIVSKPVTAEAATLYYNQAVNTDWNTLGNWWNDAGHTSQALALPGSSDNAIVDGYVYSNSGADPVLNTLTANSGYIYLYGKQITVTNGATFNNRVYWFYGTLIGNAIFNDSANNYYATITGNATFNNTSVNYGTVNGTARFNFAHAGVVTIGAGGRWGSGTAGATVGDDAVPITSGIFNGSGYNDGTLSGNAVFNSAHNGILTLTDGTWGQGTAGANVGRDGLPITSWIFNGRSGSTGAITGNPVFNGTSYHSGGTITGNATFNDSAYNDYGAITGTATFNYAHGGVITITKEWGNGTAASNVGDDGIAISSWIFRGSSLNRANITGNAIFNDTSYNYPYSGAITGNVIFNDESKNGAPITGNVTFNDSTKNILYSYYQGAVTGNACFAPTASNGGTVSGSITVCSVALPTVTTSPLSFANGTTVILKGAITNTGGASSTIVGFQYGIDTNYGMTKNKTGVFNKVSFAVSDNSLACNTLYHYRAYATNSAGTSYGSDLTFTISACSPTGGSILYGIDGSGSNPAAPNLYTIDPGTGLKLTTIGLTGNSIAGMAFHPITGILYGVTGGTDVGGNIKSLFTINKTTGAATLLGSLRDVSNVNIVFPDIAFSSDGTLYGVSAGGGLGSLYTIDVNSCNGTSDTSCLVTKIGVTTVSAYGNGIAFDSSGRLFFFGRGDDNFEELNPTNAASIAHHNFTNPSGQGYSIKATKFNESGTLFGSRFNFGRAPSDLITINLNTYTITSLGNTSDMQYMSAMDFYIPPPTAPVLDTSPASSLTSSTATLNGEITGTGGQNASSRGFQYGTTNGYGSTVTQSSGPYGVGTFSANVSSLLCNTLYHFRAFATNSAGTTNGSDDTFTTVFCPPNVDTLSATSVSQTSVVLNGNITNTGGENANTAGFQYGLTTSYGSVSSTPGNLGAGIFTANVSSLACGTLYHFRAFAGNSGGTTNGSDATFNTASCGSSGGGGGGGGGGGSSSPSTNVVLNPTITPVVPNLLPNNDCKPGENFSSSTGQPCPNLPATDLGCVQGNLFSSTTGKACGVSSTVIPNTVPNSNLTLNCTITTTLKVGSRGAEVKCLQNSLNLIPDGSFGPKTKAAVILFQKSQGLVADGIFGAKSRAAWALVFLN